MYARRRLAILSVSLLAAAMLWGCGSNGSGGSDVVVPSPENVQTLGIDNCLTCHLDGAASVARVWLDNVHGNPDLEPVSALMEASCLVCHDQLGDGQRLAAATNGVEPNRPVVSCESCHGGGSAHRGIGPLPFPKPDHERCGQCHNETFPHGFAPEGGGIVEAFRDSPHTRSINDRVLASPDVRARCSKCHTDEGAKLYRNVDGDFDELVAAIPDSTPPVADASAIDCRTCHQAHMEQNLLETEGAGRSSEFNTCTNCHELLESGSIAQAVAYHDPAVDAADGDLARVITDTHFATPGNWLGANGGANVNDITGYAMDFADERVCRNCHNPHSADITINQQWAESRHADKTAVGAWAHYNWTEVAGAIRNDGSATSSRTACQRCHTTRGVIKLLTETNGNTLAYVPFTDYDRNYKPEMLHCNGCHTDNLGGLRSVGPITVDFATVGFTFPDALASNVCLACHTGRESGLDIKADTDPDGVRSFINSHYLSAGGTVYTATGYEYTGQNYDNPASYRHDVIGTPDSATEAGTPVDTGSKGPCIGCHMSAPNKHRFLPVVIDEATGAITAITSPVCASCHTGADALSPAILTEEKEHFHAALEALDAQLAARGMFFFEAHPYFYNAPGGQGGGFTNWAGVAVALGLPAVPGYQDVMGAAFNFNLFEHDPGAFAHNRFYVKRLIFDSIDLLDNGLLDGSTGTAIDALVAADALDAAEAELAKAYLDGDSLTAGVQRP
jgi:hypothetical protein